MNPVVAHFLLGLWLVVGGLISVALCVVVGARNGFHIRRQVHRKSGVVTDSTLKWFVIIAALFMGPPLFLLGLQVIGDALYSVTETLAKFWWVPLGLFVVVAAGLVGWHFLTRRTVTQVGGPYPVERISQEEPLYWTGETLPAVYGPPAYGAHGEGGLGIPPKPVD